MADITVKKGDTWNGASYEILLNGSPLDLTGASILCQLKKSATDCVVALEFTETNGITIADAVNGLFVIDATIIDITAREYVYDIQITLANGRVITPVNGIFVVTQDISS